MLRRALGADCRLPRGATLLVAVSGGADSTALLVALTSLAHEFGLRLHAAHLDHGLRGREGADDARGVRELCERLGVPLASARWDCRARMRRRALSGEAGLRTLRREFLRAAARGAGAAAIATAHTADDQLETMVLRLARGTSLTGIAGMRARHGAWMKPLLGATRADVEHDLEHAGLAWREDASNASSAYARNRVRHSVVPALLDALGTPAHAHASERRAGLARRAAQLARDLGEAERVLARRAARTLDRLIRADRRGAVLDVAGLAALPAPVRALALRRAWRLLGPGGPGAPGLTRSHLTPLLQGLTGGRTRARFGLPGGWSAVRERGMLRFESGARGDSRQPRASQRDGAPDAILRGVSTRVRKRPAAGPAPPSPKRIASRRAHPRHP